MQCLCFRVASLRGGWVGMRPGSMEGCVGRVGIGAGAGVLRDTRARERRARPLLAADPEPPSLARLCRGSLETLRE